VKIYFGNISLKGLEKWENPIKAIEFNMMIVSSTRVRIDDNNPIWKI